MPRYDQQVLHRVGEQNFSLLAPSQLHAAVGTFTHDPVRYDYCGDCADALVEHLAACGLRFHHHAHGHSFVGNDEFVLDVWPDGRPKLWYLDDPTLAGTIYASDGGHACWCGEPGFERERVGYRTEGIG